MSSILIHNLATQTQRALFGGQQFGLNIEYHFFMNNSEEYLKREFVHLLSDTLALLGAEKRLVDDIKAMKETPLTLSMIDRIRSYNREQSDKMKATAALLNTTFSCPVN